MNQPIETIIGDMSSTPNISTHAIYRLHTHHYTE